jgi:hypothetical protein
MRQRPGIMASWWYCGKTLTALPKDAVTSDYASSVPGSPVLRGDSPPNARAAHQTRGLPSSQSTTVSRRLYSHPSTGIRTSGWRKLPVVQS